VRRLEWYDTDLAEELLREGRYRIVGTLGEGAQGTTFEARDERAGKSVAIKRFTVRGASSWKDVELAEREASVLSSLSHPALPAHIEHFEEAGALYLVMELIEGENLATRLRRGAPLGQDEVVRFLLEAGALLEYLQNRSPPVIHRDINPKNVICRPDGGFAFVDFGAVRARLSREAGSTVVGTFGYMAPEQFQGRALPVSDVYAVGATALRLLTGREPEDLPHRGLAIDVRSALDSRTDRRLAEALSRMLDPDPDRRATRIAPLLGDWSKRFSKGAPGDGERDGARPRAGRESRKHARHRQRRAASKARRDAASDHWQRPHTGARLPPLLVFGARLGLALAVIAVGFAVVTLVPLLLWILSLLFGSGLRRAAASTRQGGKDAIRAILRARRRVIASGETFEENFRARIADAQPLPSERVRVVESEAEAAEADAEVEQDDAERPARRESRR
jgi:hypothetical protein